MSRSHHYKIDYLLHGGTGERSQGQSGPGGCLDTTPPRPTVKNRRAGGFGHDERVRTASQFQGLHGNESAQLSEADSVAGGSVTAACWWQRCS